MPVSIQDGGLATQDSSEVLLYVVDYDIRGNLAPGVELASVGTFTITPPTLTPLVQSNQALQAGNRKAQVLISGGIVGRTYVVEHTVSTNESPAQTKSKWWHIRIT